MPLDADLEHAFIGHTCVSFLSLKKKVKPTRFLKWVKAKRQRRRNLSDKHERALKKKKLVKRGYIFFFVFFLMLIKVDFPF